MQSATTVPSHWNPNATLWLCDEKERDDYLNVLQMVKERGGNLRFASPRLQDDFDIVYFAVKNDGHALEYASLALRNDASIVKAAVAQEGLALYFASERFKADEEVVLQAMRRDPDALYCAAVKLRDNEVFMRKAIEINGAALGMASPRLQAVYALARRAVEKNPDAYRHVDLGLRREPGLAQTAMRQPSNFAYMDRETQLLVAPRSLGITVSSREQAMATCHQFPSLPTKWREDREIALQAVALNGAHLEYVGTVLQADRALVMVAVGQYGQALRYASASMRGDPEVVLRAVRKQSEALQFAVTELRHDLAFAKQALTANGLCMEWLPREHQGNRELAFIAVQDNGHAFLYCDASLWRDVNLAKAALRKGMNFYDLPGEMRNNKDILLVALAQPCRVDQALRIWQWVPASLRQDISIAQAAVEGSPARFQFLAQEMRNQLAHTVISKPVPDLVATRRQTALHLTH